MECKNNDVRRTDVVYTSSVAYLENSMSVEEFH